LVQEEIRRNAIDGSSSKHDDEGNCALAGKEKKGKGRLSYSKFDSCPGEQKKDMTKIKCFHYHEVGHFATKCLHKKTSRGAVGEALDLEFELDFTLISCMVSSMMGSVWYLDSGASFQMTGNKYLFSNLEEKDLHM